MRIQHIDFRVFLPWFAFLFSIILSALCNPETTDLVLSVATTAKFIVIATIFALLITMQFSIKDLESFFTLSMMVGLGGFAIAMLHADWILRYGDGRLAWVWAWGGVFWKMGAYALPFYIYRAMQKPSWFDLPTLTLAASIVALDGSRTGLLVIIATMMAAAICIKLFKLNANCMRFVFICVASTNLAYMFIQPAIARAIVWGGFWTIIGCSGLFCLLAAAYFQLRSRCHMAIKLMGVALMMLAGVFYVKTDDQSTKIHTVDSTHAVHIIALDRLTSGDSTRMGMLAHGIRSAISNFPLGGGLGSTTADDHGTQVHIHMTYLQLLSDLGLIGILAYLAIFLLSVLWFFRIEKETRASVLPALAIVFVYLAQGCFAPLSNEITEWFPVVLAFSVLYHLAHNNIRKI